MANRKAEVARRLSELSSRVAGSAEKIDKLEQRTHFAAKNVRTGETLRSLLHQIADEQVELTLTLRTIALLWDEIERG